MNSKNIFSLFIFFLVLVALVPFSAAAQNLNLGEFYQDELSRRFSQPANLSVDGQSYVLAADEIQNWIKPVEIIRYDMEYTSEIENPYFCLAINHLPCRLTQTVRQSQKLRKVTLAYLDTESARKYLEDLARQIDRDPADAKLQMEDGKVSLFELSSKGKKLDQEDSLKILLSNLKNDYAASAIELAYQELEPEISLESINNLGIENLIGEGRSNFKGSPRNRIYNIKVATNRFHGVLIKPGEEFSFVSILGEVDGEHGYLPELVIKKDKTEPEFGGGICQVSTTTFRAAINSGLQITARKNHAYPVQYYNPQGMDATVYVPRPDLRFINNTPGHILIQTKIDGTELIFQFFGKSDGRRIEIIGPKITERNGDGSLKATFTQKVYDANDEIIIDDVFNSSYDSPNKYPHPGDVLKQKPSGWSEKQWRAYKKENNI